LQSQYIGASAVVHQVNVYLISKKFFEFADGRFGEIISAIRGCMSLICLDEGVHNRGMYAGVIVTREGFFYHRPGPGAKISRNKIKILILEA
jgi:hypothetical protein